MDQEEKEAFAAWGKSRPFQAKIEKAKAVIQQGLSLGNSYVAISWGKDSTVLLHLCQQVWPGIKAISLGHPDRELISNYAEVESQYCERFPTDITTITLPGESVPSKVLALELWKEFPVAFVGLRAEESIGRRKTLQVYGMVYQYKLRGFRVCPLAFWKTNDIWTYIATYDLPYLKAYDEGHERTTDHVSRHRKSMMHEARLEMFKRHNFEFYSKLIQEIYEAEA